MVEGTIERKMLAEYSDNVRINLIKNGLYFLAETYGFGVGAGNLHYWLRDRTVYDVGQIMFIHNWYIEVLVTFGVLFFVIYMLFHITVFLDLYKNIDRNNIWSLNNVFLMSYIVFSIVCISSSSNTSAEWVWMYFASVSTYCLCKQMTKTHLET